MAVVGFAGNTVLTEDLLNKWMGEFFEKYRGYRGPLTPVTLDEYGEYLREKSNMGCGGTAVSAVSGTLKTSKAGETSSSLYLNGIEVYLKSLADAGIKVIVRSVLPGADPYRYWIAQITKDGIERASGLSEELGFKLYGPANLIADNTPITTVKPATKLEASISGRTFQVEVKGNRILVTDLFGRELVVLGPGVREGTVGILVSENGTTNDLARQAR